jgi:hypothetical protein
MLNPRILFAMREKGLSWMHLAHTKNSAGYLSGWSAFSLNASFFLNGGDGRRFAEYTYYRCSFLVMRMSQPFFAGLRATFYSTMHIKFLGDNCLISPFWIMHSNCASLPSPPQSLAPFCPHINGIALTVVDWDDNMPTSLSENVT